jgi:hypothetical protein
VTDDDIAVILGALVQLQRVQGGIAAGLTGLRDDGSTSWMNSAGPGAR